MADPVVAGHPAPPVLPQDRRLLAEPPSPPSGDALDRLDRMVGLQCDEGRETLVGTVRTRKT
ncbi:hypothetical protein [Methylobacterium mesophilicum]|uniref:hypothetical protein n=1 Tax=Methylobacterium mesophilicum TaxID=39956 RepID=UPI0002C5FD9E|nr:hypothetical protein [Methylobacterium mesophilicum]